MFVSWYIFVSGGCTLRAHVAKVRTWYFLEDNGSRAVIGGREWTVVNHGPRANI